MAKALSSLIVKHTISADDIQENTANHGVQVDGITIRDATVTADDVNVKSFQLKTGATSAYVLTCNNPDTGNGTWAPLPGSSVIENVTTTPWEISALSSEAFVPAINQTYHVTLPQISCRRSIVVRNTSTTQNVVLHTSGTDHIWTRTQTTLTLPPECYVSLEAVSGVWMPC